MRKVAAHTTFTAEDILRIREFRDAGADPREVADLYDVAPSTIRKIWRGDTFRHVGVPGKGVMDRPPANPLYTEPTHEEIEASKRRLAELLRAQGLADELVRELEGEPSDPIGATPKHLEGSETDQAPLSDEQAARLEKLRADPFANVEAARKYI